MNGPETDAAGMAGHGLASPDGVQGGRVDAASLAVEAKGLKGGVGRADGLVPGSPEARKADREKDAQRKREARAARRARKDAPPLPSALGTMPDAPDAAPTPDAGPPPVPWNPDDVRPLAKRLFTTLEKVNVRLLLKKARELEGMDDAFLAEVEKDARWDSDAKDDLVSAGAEWGAKLLDKMGIPAGSASGLRFVSGLVQIAVQQLLLFLKLDDFAARSRPPAPSGPAFQAVQSSPGGAL